MHWLVEVSRIGDPVASERYCIEARRWQSALQEARRMRGDAGALPRLTIELLDSGYRAVDPELNVRYVVSEAPPDMPLTDGARTVLSTHPPPAELISVAPVAPAALATHAPLDLTPTTPLSPRSPDAPVPAPSAGAPPASPTAAAPPAASMPSVEPGRSVEAAPSAEASPADAAPPPARPSSSRPPGFVVQVIRQRDEKPSEANPIAYRELALAVKGGASRAEVEALLLARLEEARLAMPTDTRRFVQFAVFDHVFVKRPVRPPLGTLLWKDWRGDPVLAFPGFGEPGDSIPPSSTSTARMPSWSPSMMTSLTPVVGSVPAQAAPSSPATTTPLATGRPASVPGAAPAPFVAPAPPVAPSLAAPPDSSNPAAAVPGSVRPMRVVSVGPSQPPPAAPVVTSAPAAPIAASAPAALAAEAERVAAAVQSVPPPQPSSARRSDPGLRPSDPASARRSDPTLAHRRPPGEDLIGDLFERMHDLNFMADIVSGADFVLNVLYDLIPCEAMLVHVFDLGRREFVVVRAHGPNFREALLFRTPDSDPLVLEVMRQRSIVSNGAPSLRSGAFERQGVHPSQVLSGSARQGGRYLGFIELANPQGGAPFHQGEANALEYVCEQFAEFVAARPVVLDEDLVLRA
jgi:hypothetical protein